MILGINDGHDAGVALVEPTGHVVYAANEERYTGRKQQWGFPHESLARLLRESGASAGEITDVAVGFQGLVETEGTSTLEDSEVGVTRRLFTLATAAAGPLMATPPATWFIQAATRALRRNRAVIREALAAHGITAPVHFVHHHEAHAASAYLTAGHDRCAVITCDAGGDGLSGALYLGEGGRLERLATLPRIHSLGDFWLAITLLCGFNPDRHGGKVTGLAAHKPCPPALAALRELYETVPGRFLIRNREHRFWRRLVGRLQRLLARYDRAEIAWAAQRLLEELMVHLVREAMARTGSGPLAVAGGVFANVKMNLEILRLPEVSDFFVHPHMGDGGTGLGAALAIASRRHGAVPHRLDHVFLGTEAGNLTDEQLAGFQVETHGDREELAQATARLLADDTVVGLVQGRMEYGPRALMHRSILYHPFDASIMDWLNQRLSRTEFMPFAPVLAREDASRYFDLVDKGEAAARYMTVCLPAKPVTRTQAPAIVHVDETARPQLVDSDETPFAHSVVQHFGRITGVPIIINTSFNRHERPIIAEAVDGLEELARGVVDALVLEDRIVRRS